MTQKEDKDYQILRDIIKSKIEEAILRNMEKLEIKSILPKDYSIIGVKNYQMDGSCKVVKFSEDNAKKK